MGQTTQILVPDIGGFDDVEIIELAVAPGDTINADDTLITLESDKATMDVPSPQPGTVTSVHVKVGDRVSQGTMILELDSETAAAATPDQGAPEASISPSDVDRSPAPAPTPEAPTSPAPATTTEETKRPPPAATLADESQTSASHPHATPSVRRFARELGVDIGKVKGHGRKGRILRDDVQRYVKSALEKPAAPAGSGIPPIPAVDFTKFGPVESRPLSRIKRISGPRLHAAWLNLPMVTHHDEADVTELEAFRQSLKAEAEKRGVRVTALAFLMKALVAALREFPQFNASLDADGETLVLKQYFHIGVAMDTPNGLVVPVIRDVDQMGIWDLGAALADTSIRAREGKLKPNEMQGGCMSISSLGGIGGTAFTPIVNPPEVAILGVTRARMSPVWDGKEFQPRLMQPLDLTYDHRVIDGAEAARFTVFLCQTLGDLRRLLL